MSLSEALALPARTGPRPVTTRHIPHTQVDQQPDAGLRARLTRRIANFPGTEERPSGISLPGALALCLPDGTTAGADDAFLVDREFAHLHPFPDSSLHLALPRPVAEATVEAGWAEFHPLAGSDAVPPTIVMVYAPRNDDELEIVLDLVMHSLRFATQA